MSIVTIKSSARTRFNEVFTFLTYVGRIEPQDVTPPSLEVKIMRGLFYVHLYAAVEKTINELVIDVLSSIKIENIKNKDFAVHFNAISLHSKLQSFKHCNSNNFFEKARVIFMETESDETPTINEMMMGIHLQNVRYATLENVSDIFGLIGFDFNPHHKILLDEIVEKRNAVAHGRESASVIGQTHNTSILRNKMMDVQSLIFSYIDLFDNYMSSKKYIKVSSLPNYVS